MSYILDALQRAQAERERGEVPGLHARQAVAATPAMAGGSRVGLWLGLGTVLLLAAAFAGWWLARTPVNAPTAGVASVPAPRDPVVVAPLPIAQPVPIAAAITPSKPRETASAAPLVVAATTPVTAPKPLQMPSATASHPAVNNTTAPAPWLADLPQDMRQQLPKLTITGTVYSENPAQRMLVVNGQVLTQGVEAAPELQLLEIHPTFSEFVFRGTRFKMAH